MLSLSARGAEHLTGFSPRGLQAAYRRPLGQRGRRVGGRAMPGAGVCDPPHSGLHSSLTSAALQPHQCCLHSNAGLSCCVKAAGTAVAEGTELGVYRLPRCLLTETRNPQSSQWFGMAQMREVCIALLLHRSFVERWVRLAKDSDLFLCLQQQGGPQHLREGW